MKTTTLRIFIKPMMTTTLPRHLCVYLNWCGDALLVAAKTFALFPAHSLKHFVPDVVTVEAIFSGLLVVTVHVKMGNIDHLNIVEQTRGSIKWHFTLISNF